MIQANRVLVKLSGEAFANKEKGLAIDPSIAANIANQFKDMIKDGVQIAVVIGGGNFWRGATAEKNGIPRNRADYIGMLATVMNGLALQSSFEEHGIKTRIQSSLNIDQRVAENYVNEKAIHALEKGEVVIFAGGTGRPFFTTDTAATLFASEIKASLILMGKNGVDGVYDKDPKINKDAVHFDTLSYDEFLIKDLKAMDKTAASMANNNNLEIIVFDINEEDSLIKASKKSIKHTLLKVGK